MVYNIKEIFTDYVVFIKIGNFYECYNDDACIISYLFGYKIKNMVSNDKTCDFPLSSINKVISNLKTRCINYILIDKVHNYGEIDKMNFKKKNNYNIVKDKALEHINKIDRINKI